MAVLQNFILMVCFKQLLALIMETISTPDDDLMIGSQTSIGHFF